MARPFTFHLFRFTAAVLLISPGCRDILCDGDMDDMNGKKKSVDDTEKIQGNIRKVSEYQREADDKGGTGN